MIEAVIFDVDGTLIDSVDDHARAWVWAFARHGVDVTFEDVRIQIGKGGDQLMPVFMSDEDVARVGEAMSKERGDFFKEEYLPHLRPFPDVRELFERILADGKRIILASSAKKDELQEYKKIARVDDLIEDETTADDSEKSKPHPDIFHAALATIPDVDPANVIVIGDTGWDAEAAGKAGLRTIGLLCGGFPEAMLKDAGCVAIYASPSDLLARYDDSLLAGKAGG